MQYGLATSGAEAKVGKASNGIGFNVDCLRWLEKYYPQDLAKIYEVFPLCERVLFEWHAKNDEKE